MTANTIEVRVFDGPNADRAFDSAKYAFDEHNKVFVMFRVDILNPDNTPRLKGVAFKARVTSIEYESGSPGMLNISFNVEDGSVFYRGHGFYDANRRTGTLKLEYR